MMGMRGLRGKGKMVKQCENFGGENSCKIFFLLNGSERVDKTIWE